ncbi:MAG: SDR family oxidoreductase [Pseudomonadota bacterium]
MTDLPVIAVLGASGLIGQSVAFDLMREGFPIAPVARRYTAAQTAAFSDNAIVCPIADISDVELRELLLDRRIDIVVNCLGVLQDSRRDRIENVHCGFIQRLTKALNGLPRQALLVHLSVPGFEDEDSTEFSRTKRAGERLIAESSVPFVILRPGFVIAPNAYGGSALFRALAVLPFVLPQHVSERPFAITDVADIARTISFVAHAWSAGQRNWRETWDVMARDPSTVEETVMAFRHRLGGPARRLRLPLWLLELSAKAGDLIARLGWRPPIRSTALRELRRGVVGNPASWIAATQIEPTPLRAILMRLPPTIQEQWFSRLYLAKAAILAALVFFWLASGLIALIPAFAPATAILEAHGFSTLQAMMITVVSSLIDISVGAAIASRRSCRVGLVAGIAISLFYMIGAAIVTPDLWIEPLGALVKTVPAIVLMLVSLAILEDR